MAGRPRIDPNGEIRKSKVTVYLTESTYENIQDLSRLNRMSVANYIAALIEKDAERQADKLKIFRELVSK